MTDTTESLTKNQWIALAVFLFGIVCTAVLIGYGITGTPLPKWILALAAII